MEEWKKQEDIRLQGPKASCGSSDASSAVLLASPCIAYPKLMLVEKLLALQDAYATARTKDDLNAADKITDGHKDALMELLTNVKKAASELNAARISQRKEAKG